MPELSVVVPVFNEMEVLPVLVERVRQQLDALDLRWELVLVNDGSRDASWPILLRLRSEDPRLVLVNLSRNFGHQLAITAGMDHSTGDAVVVMDADLQDPPEVIPEMLAEWRSGYDVVYAVRTQRQAESVFKRATAAAYYRVLQAMSPVDIPVDAGDFRLMSRRAVTALQQMPERARYVRGMVAWLGFPQSSVVFERQPRFAGRTKYPFRKMLLFATDGLMSFSALPLRVATSLGLVMGAAAVAYAVYAVAMKLAFATAIQGWTSLVGVIVFIGSAQLVCIGIIGEYVGRIYDEVKGRPLYFVADVHRGPLQEAEHTSSRVARHPRDH